MTAQLFLEEGAKVVLVDLDEALLKKTIAELVSTNVIYCASDVTKTADVQRYINDTVKVFGKVDVFLTTLILRA
jgi:NADP-dependent 3-hydroxy acid dehydrogenase YdfG